MIVGSDIIERGLIVGGSPLNLKNSTYDLTIGEIVPIGKKAVKARRANPNIPYYYLEPREMVWVLSQEEFNMPATVTGIATLRTTFTKQGMLALNVGIIDPLFRGPISTALINFSDRPRRVEVGDKFFRVTFFGHEDVTDFNRGVENVERARYIRDLENVSYGDFARSFLNIPNFDDEFYAKKFWSIIRQGLFRNTWLSIPLGIFLVIVFWFLVEKGFWGFLLEKYSQLSPYFMGR